MRHRKTGDKSKGAGKFWSIIQLLVLSMLWYVVAHTDDKLHEKYALPVPPAPHIEGKK